MWQARVLWAVRLMVRRWKNDHKADIKVTSHPLLKWIECKLAIRMIQKILVCFCTKFRKLYQSWVIKDKANEEIKVDVEENELNWSRVLGVQRYSTGRKETAVGGRTQASTPGCFSSFYLDWDWDPVSALDTAPVKTYRNMHLHTHAHTWSGGKSKRCLNSTETLQRLSESSCAEQWPRGGDYTLITTCVRAHTHTNDHSEPHMYTEIHGLPQMWDSGL